MKRRITIVVCAFFAALMTCNGCSVQETDGTKIADLDYTVVEYDKVPEELIAEIEQKKEADFKMTYETDEYLYIVRGYGEKETGGYSIAVNDVYQTTNSIYFKTTLIGPEDDKESVNAPSYPYIVVKIEYQDMNVVFE